MTTDMKCSLSGPTRMAHTAGAAEGTSSVSQRTDMNTCKGHAKNTKLCFMFGTLAASLLTHANIASAQSCEPLPLIENGSFELPLVSPNSIVRETPTAWTWGTGSTGFIFNGNNGYPWPGPAHLVQFMDIGNSSGPLFQQFTVSDRSICHLSWFDNAAVTAFGNSPYIVTLLELPSLFLFYSSFNAGNGGVWMQRSTTFVLLPGSYTLSFQSNGVIGGFDTLIDRVTFLCEQTPGAFAGPSSIITCTQSTISFDVDTTGKSPFTYQWQKDGAPIDPLLNPSATTDILTLTNITSSDIASYDCIVTNSCGTVTSNPVTLTICLGDFNCDGGINGEDIEAFFTDWESGNPAADINEDGGIDGSDVEVFFSRWEAGC